MANPRPLQLPIAPVLTLSTAPPAPGSVPGSKRRRCQAGGAQVPPCAPFQTQLAHQLLVFDQIVLQVWKHR